VAMPRATMDRSATAEVRAAAGRAGRGIDGFANR
jgi:hypothetical protein